MTKDLFSMNLLLFLFMKDAMFLLYVDMHISTDKKIIEKSGNKVGWLAMKANTNF